MTHTQVWYLPPRRGSTKSWKTHQKRIDGRVDGQDENDQPCVEIGGNVDVGQGHDFQKDGGHPAEAVGEDDEKEADGYFDFVGSQRRGRPRPPDADKQRRVHAHNHQNAAWTKRIKFPSVFFLFPSFESNPSRGR